MFIEIGSRKKEAPFAVKTPKRTITGSQARVAVRTGTDGTGVVVAQGRVEVSDLDKPILAGQQLVPGADKPVAVPRASHLLAWTHDLIAAAESPLVPCSSHTGGALVAIDPNGQEAKLSLRKYHIDVHIEDGFARTTIDQTYFNHEPFRMEGTFYFPLPPDASLSRLAMYVDGNLMEGGMAERDYARQVFESIMYRQKDPALLEWVDGSTFKMRVFPLEGRQEKRIILSYTQRLPVLYGRTQYRFPAGHSLGVVNDWSFHARLKDGANLAWSSASYTLKPTKDGADLILETAAKNVKPDRDVTLFVSEKETDTMEESIRFSSAEHEGSRYLMLRYRPNLPSPQRQQGQRRDWIFLFESSGDRDPLLARTQIEIVRSLLSQAEPDDTFVVAAAGTRVKMANANPQAVTSENVQAAIAFLEKSHLIGAFDLGRALTEVEPLLKAGKNPHLVHVGSGVAAMGERRDDVLAKRILEGTRYVGIGVGKRWARNFMKAAAARTGGYFTQINPDESIGWRTFDLAATLNTPRLLDIKVADTDKRAPFLTDINSLAQGEELWAITRLGPEVKAVPAQQAPAPRPQQVPAPRRVFVPVAHLDPDEKALPESVTITGLLDGQPFQKVIPVKNVAEHADYLPRTWAKLEIDRLLADDAGKNKKDIVELSKQMYVMTPFTSLLVLENEDMYTQYKVDRGRKDHWAMYPCPAKIPVVYEPLPGQPVDARNAPKGTQPTAAEVMQTIMVRNSWSSRRDGDRRQPVSAEPLSGLGLILTSDVPSPATIVDYSGSMRLGDDRVDIGIQQPVLMSRGILARTVAERMAQSYLDAASGASVDGSIVPHGSMASSAIGGFSNATGGFSNAQQPEQRFHFFYLDPTSREPVTVDKTPVYTVQNAIVRAETSFLSGGLQGVPHIPTLGVGRLEDFEVYAGGGYGGGGIVAGYSFGGGGYGGGSSNFLSNCPTWNSEDRYFFDLVAYCPGMNTSLADIRAVHEAEAPPSPSSRPGTIDPAARRLFDKARPAGWQSVTIPAEANQPALTIIFDGTGRYTYERTLPPGLKEQVICDGKTLLHLYPDLGIGARRNVSRFQRIDFARIVPWALPLVEDLARGADLKMVDERTVALVPHGVESAKDAEGKALPYMVLHFVFGTDGKLAERQIVEMPSKKLIRRETANDEKVKVSEAKAPELTPDTKKLVVLPLPYRSPDHVRKALKLEKKSNEGLRFEEALVLFAANFGSQKTDELNKLFRQSFHNRDQRQLGFYVLLAACGLSLDAEHGDVLSEHPNEPLAQYLALYSSPVLRHPCQPVGRKHRSMEGRLFAASGRHARSLSALGRQQACGEQRGTAASGSETRPGLCPPQQGHSVRLGAAGPGAGSGLSRTSHYGGRRSLHQGTGQ